MGQRLLRHADSPQPSAHQISQYAQPPVLILPRGTLDGAQYVIPGRKNGGRNAQGVQVCGKAGGFRFTGGHKTEWSAQLGSQRGVDQRTARSG